MQKLIFLFCLIFLFTNCVQQDNEKFSYVSGKFIDSYVTGLTYKTNNKKIGATNDEGLFYYQPNEKSIQFLIGSISLGETAIKNSITPLDLIDGAADNFADNNVMDDAVVNILRLLQTLDENNFPDDGISINVTLTKVLIDSDISIDFNVSIDTFENNINVKNLILLANQTSLVSATKAKKHFHDSMDVLNEIPGFLISSVLGNTNEKGRTTSFYLGLKTKPTANVTVGISSSDTTEGIVSPTTVIFTPDNYTNREITVTGIDDQIEDEDVSFDVIFSKSNSTDQNYHDLTLDSLSIINEKKKAAWTFMMYMDADNNLEANLLEDIQEIKEGYIDGEDIEVIVLIDRIVNYSYNSEILGSDFTDTRLYRITHDTATRISGDLQFPEITTSSNYEANMGDAETLKKFIQFTKAHYPADHYALIISNHGGGTRSRNLQNNDISTIALRNNLISSSRAIAWDDSNGKDALYIAEITDVLTEAESVDLLGFDACLMGSIEVAYQFRPANNSFHAQVLVASPPEEWSNGWKFDEIFQRMKAGGGHNGTPDTTGLETYEAYYDAVTITPQQLSAIIVEEQYDSVSSYTGQALSSYDLSKVAIAKLAIDKLAQELAINSNKDYFRNTIYDSIAYFDIYNYNYWVLYPFFDVYSFANNIFNDSNYSTDIRTYANKVMQAIDDLVLYSFAQSNYTDSYTKGFTNGKYGIHIFAPNGNYWPYQWWYNALDVKNISVDGYLFDKDQQLYGKLSWCADGATVNNGQIENWFEMLDNWYDESNNTNGYTP